ncbi:hypothetical protein, partial [Agrobacterium rosae]|uniref:hypothetical protein n=1 Tax=Agrobacterium rosae TaxID=1972867 RepID=UPI003B9F94D4
FLPEAKYRSCKPRCGLHAVPEQIAKQFVSCKGRTFCLLGTPIFNLFSAFRLNDERPLIAALGIGWAEVCFCLRRYFYHVLCFADLAATYSPAS